MCHEVKIYECEEYRLSEGEVRLEYVITSDDTSRIVGMAIFHEDKGRRYTQESNTDCGQGEPNLSRCYHNVSQGQSGGPRLIPAAHYLNLRGRT